MNYCGLSTCDTANGTGIRVSLFVSGCRVHCKGCFNKDSWDFNSGKPFTEDTAQTILQAMAEPCISGFSLLGGDPFEPEHQATLAELLRRIKERFPKKSIWAWTGRTFAHVKNSPLIPFIDVLIDGPFVEKLKIDHQGEWKGSSNQRVIHLH